MRSFARLALISTALLCATMAFAASEVGKQYRWKDAEGEMHFSDTLPAEALLVGYDVINPQGLVIKHVDRVKTPEELKADDAAAKLKLAAQRKVDDQTKADQQMLAAYPAEQDLIMGQRAQLDMIDQNVHATEVSLVSQEKSLTDLLDHAASVERSGKPIPDALKKQIDTLRANVDKQKGYITRKQQEKIETAKKFTSELDHYRELRSKSDSKD